MFQLFRQANQELRRTIGRKYCPSSTHLLFIRLARPANERASFSVRKSRPTHGGWAFPSLPYPSVFFLFYRGQPLSKQQNGVQLPCETSVSVELSPLIEHRRKTQQLSISQPKKKIIQQPTTAKQKVISHRLNISCFVF